MSDERLQIRLGSQNSKESANTDSFLSIEMNGDTRLLPSSLVTRILDVGERFDVERQRSKYYRIMGTINPTISNALFNLDDSGPYLDLYTWKGFNYSNPATADFRFNNPIYPDVVRDYLKETNGWFGYFDPNLARSGFCTFFDMEPKKQRFSFIPDINPYHSASSFPVKNWEMTITYPASIDSTHNMVAGGLLILEAIPVIVATRQMTAIGVACLHNVNTGDVVRITGTNGYDGDHVVVRTGLDNGDLKENYFVIDVPPTGSVSFNSRFKKVFGGVEVKYYFRKFRKIKTRNAPVIETDDYEAYKLAFSETVFNDDVVQFAFNEDIDVSDLKDNLGRPLSQLYLTIIKTDSNGLFTNVSSGIECNFIPELNTSTVNPYLRNIPVINKIHNGGQEPFPSHIPLENNVAVSNNNGTGDDFYGDLVEYSPNEVRETVLADVMHRFNTINRQTNPSMTYILTPRNDDTVPPATAVTETISLGPRQEGYYYKPHHLIEIRKFSTYIEQGDVNTENKPEYAVNLGDGRYLWRDLMDIGVNEIDQQALDYPFLNGCHYLYANYCFYVKRQDPFDNWDLYYSPFPSDPIGEKLNDNFVIKTEDNVC
jgi:hypothetical protein